MSNIPTFDETQVFQEEEKEAEPILDETQPFSEEEPIDQGYLPVAEEKKKIEEPTVDITTQYMMGLMSKVKDESTHIDNAYKIFQNRGYEVVHAEKTSEGMGIVPTYKYTLQDEHGDTFYLDEGGFQQSMWDIAGNIGQYSGGIIGGVVGKTPTAVSAGQLVGNMFDQYLGYLITGEELSATERSIEFGKTLLEVGVEQGAGKIGSSIFESITKGKGAGKDAVAEQLRMEGLQFPDLSADVIERLETRGFNILRSDLDDDIGIQRLLVEMKSNPRTASIIEGMTNDNKKALFGELRSIVGKYSDDSVLSSQFTKEFGEEAGISPRGAMLKGGLEKQKQSKELKYDRLFEEVKELDDSSIIEQTDDLSETITGWITKGSPSEIKNISIQGQALLKKIGSDLQGRNVTPTELLDLMKRYRNSMNSDEKVEKAVYARIEHLLSSKVDSMVSSMPEGSAFKAKLTEANDEFKDYLKFYGKESPYPSISKILIEPVEGAIKTLKTSKNPLTDALAIRRQFMELDPKGADAALKEIAKDLFIDSIDQGKLLKSQETISGLVADLNKINFKQIEVLGGKEMASDLKTIAQMADVVAKYEIKAGEGALATSGFIDKALSYPFRMAKEIFAKRQLAKALTDRAGTKALIKTLRNYKDADTIQKIMVANEKSNMLKELGAKTLTAEQEAKAKRMANKKLQAELSKLESAAKKASAEEKKNILQQQRLLLGLKVGGKPTKGKTGLESDAGLHRIYGTKDPVDTKAGKLGMSKQYGGKATGTKGVSGEDADVSLRVFLDEIANPSAPIDQDYIKQMLSSLKVDEKQSYGFSKSKMNSFNKLKSMLNAMSKYSRVKQKDIDSVRKTIKDYLDAE